MLKRIIYRSHIAEHVGGTEIRQLSIQAKATNSTVGIQGALIAINRYFYQVLEGEDVVLTPLLKKIQLDHRHYDFTLLQDLPIESSKFDGWDMTLIMSPPPDLETCIEQINTAFDKKDTSETVQQRLCEGLVYIILGAVDMKPAPL
ncbi:BLUF domain-containing protein [Alteromonas sp. H39]|uniref:BLUF domain-containing protein n=1 Tax=Alteromonas sp. H39 TaxID=3389876 RepID=UPI0039E17AD8